MRPAGNVFPFFSAVLSSRSLPLFRSLSLHQPKKTNFILYDQRPHGDDAFVICITVRTTKEKLMSVIVVHKAVLWLYVGFYADRRSCSLFIVFSCFFPTELLDYH